ncbi:hypothetical protein JTM75_12935 [Pseudomonas aeruginosa]|nr:hypothetical protein [Pseudomonas aeruginosa]
MLKTLGAIGAGAGLMGPTAEALAAIAGRVVLPFDNGERELVAFPQKRPLILLTSRPPQLEMSRLSRGRARLGGVMEGRSQPQTLKVVK